MEELYNILKNSGIKPTMEGKEKFFSDLFILIAEFKELIEDNDNIDMLGLFQLYPKGNKIIKEIAHLNRLIIKIMIPFKDMIDTDPQEFENNMKLQMKAINRILKSVEQTKL